MSTQYQNFINGKWVDAKSAETFAPAARVPTAKVQTEPAELLGAQLQPAVELVGSNVALGGTVSVKITEAASWLPALEALIV